MMTAFGANGWEPEWCWWQTVCSIGCWGRKGFQLYQPWGWRCIFWFSWVWWYFQCAQGLLLAQGSLLLHMGDQIWGLGSNLGWSCASQEPDTLYYLSGSSGAIVRWLGCWRRGSNYQGIRKKMCILTWRFCIKDVCKTLNEDALHVLNSRREDQALQWICTSFM